jgi:TonB family protein
LKPVVLPLLISLLFLGGTTRAGQSFFDEGDVSSLVRLAKLNGTVSYKRLAQLVKQHGIDIKEVSNPLGQALDDNAIHTVSKWKFEPPTRNGAPVAIHTSVEISFRTF